MDRVRHLVIVDRRSQRKVSGGEALGDRHHIGLDAVFFQCPPGAGAARAAHDLVGDHDHPVLVADLAHAPGIALRRGNAAAGSTHHGLEDEGADILRPHAQDLVFEFLRTRLAHSIRCRARNRAIGVDRRQVRDVEQRALEGALPFEEAGDGKSAKRVAVPGALAGDETPAAHVALGRVILQRELHAALDRLRPASHIDHVVQRAAAAAADDLGQLLQRVGGEIIAIAMRDAVELTLDRLVHFLVRMADAIDSGAARAVDVALAVYVMDIGTLGPGDLRKVTRGMDMLGSVGGHVG